ncbi:pantothenate kinase [Candidatus Desantisbacteria bacterium CG_4_10_14_0_8_um_filter_48_22]|uniref:Type III pantothenate kinase n=1 Tax=Candidatus Desantisbacteria bacterium CG_4_10_14_0_8_um_filter_48_22 TaxID=1974543 RepID=A0A2M7S7I4_9BACT|nr:MAG: pantothenate kinase [Candidatus Desantisbacteria bacterium CG_4_10_14_0_8_um_filter_48_22]PJB28154.1 MAG: pantothenate kinase [Candidatus Desantisbacteria bacterium CG_4_9_14_3_um_filter_50_7]
MKKNKSKILLAVDMGNTAVTAGIFRGRTLVEDRISADIKNFRKELARLLKTVNGAKAGAVYVSSVVPCRDILLAGILRKATGLNPHFIKLKDAGIPVLCDRPFEVGTDRILNAVAAHRLSTREAIVVDCGTATTFDAVSRKGEYLGGAITAGIGISSEALWTRCAKLRRRFSLKTPGRILGRNTVDAMRSGIINGHTSMIEGMVARLKKELRSDPVVIGTGGYISLVARSTKIFDIIDPDLTLKGIWLVWQKKQVKS